jgi:hypothetical protein
VATCLERADFAETCAQKSVFPLPARRRSNSALFASRSLRLAGQALKTPVTEVNEAVLWVPRKMVPLESPGRELVPIFEFLLPKPVRLSSKSTVIKVIPGNRGLK